ncbi:hypothetical protein ASE63_01775 [Bosea sp. Root381]|uniref:4'-phosphopantetheinyl transferase family protein n=1 Tax=Bosea sp. Root381 TaxID=1736524 RepID=UPI0007005958|nr:4'-phosphopantetheinyl transferase superfamily protein [Bosea sp. Root381]KRE17947.1 hypothetical protein ASE63_01775 [Bosea sp. Root381]
MIWLDSHHAAAATLPAGWLIATGARPANLAERSQLRRETARRILARQLATTPDEITITHEEAGRPLLAGATGRGLHISLATRAGVVAVALAPQPVGIDVERVDPAAEPPYATLHPDEAALLRALDADERPLAFARLWAAKEAYVKALGTGFLRAPESFAVRLVSAEGFRVEDPAGGRTASGILRLYENGGQEILAAAMALLD